MATVKIAYIHMCKLKYQKREEEEEEKRTYMRTHNVYYLYTAK